MKVVKKHVLFVSLKVGCAIALVAVSHGAHASGGPIRPTDELVGVNGCFRYRSVDSPERRVDPPSDDEVWCYKPVPPTVGRDVRGLFIYNADGPNVRLELSALVMSDGLVKHASLLNGKITVHQVDSAQFNPLPVELLPPRDAERVPEDQIAGFVGNADEVLGFLLREPAAVEEVSIKEGDAAAKAASHSKPWRGYWWPYKKLRLAKGSNSPMAKYDRFVRARGGTSDAQKWELSNHQYNGVKWEGHCNGWAGSSILRTEPTRPVIDPLSKTEFSVTDLKGLLAENDFCIKYAFFGSRYRGKSDEEMRDIYPAMFHQTLTYYIGRLHKPIVMDRFRTKPVDNHIVSGYSMKIRRLSATTYGVTTVLTVHRYDKKRVDKPGSAPSYKKTFKYTIVENENGVPIGGSWKSKNPDFLWVPLSLSDCKRNNPHVKVQWVEKILSL